MKNYIFFITTTLFEGNPKTILEAMGAGCVVVAPNSKNNIEIIENNHNGYLFDLKNENPFNIIKNKDIKELENISMNAIGTVQNNYSFEKFIADELFELKKYMIKNLVNGSNFAKNSNFVFSEIVTSEEFKKLKLENQDLLIIREYKYLKLDAIWYINPKIKLKEMMLYFVTLRLLKSCLNVCVVLKP